MQDSEELYYRLVPNRCGYYISLPGAWKSDDLCRIVEEIKQRKTNEASKITQIVQANETYQIG